MIASPAVPRPDPRAFVRPLCAGLAIKNRGSGELGTIGLIVTSDGTDRWLVSCYHVLGRPYVAGRPGNWQAGDEVFQPDEAAHPLPEGIVAPLDFRAESDRTFDIAAVRLPAGAPTTPGVHGVAGLTHVMGVAEPAVGMRVIKSGRATGVTLGEVVLVRSIDGLATVVEVDFDNDELGNNLTAPGDSGAVWIDRASGAAVAMHQGETWYGGSCSISLARALPRLGLDPIRT